MSSVCSDQDRFFFLFFSVVVHRIFLYSLCFCVFYSVASCFFFSCCFASRSCFQISTSPSSFSLHVHRSWCTRLFESDVHKVAEMWHMHVCHFSLSSTLPAKNTYIYICLWISPLFFGSIFCFVFHFTHDSFFSVFVFCDFLLHPDAHVNPV